MLHEVGQNWPFAPIAARPIVPVHTRRIDSDRRLQFALEIAKMYIWERDIRSNKVERFGDAQAVLGVRVDTIDDFLGYVHVEERQMVAAAIETVIARGEPYEMEFRIVRPDGTHVWLRDVGRRVLADGRDRFIGVCIDVTSEVESRMTAARLAYHDSLTGLPNRRQVRERLDIATQGNAGNDPRIAVLCLDLDGFKAVNDSYGHKAGDELLLHVAEVLKECCGRADLVGRIGGDEFIIILSSCTYGHVDTIAARIIDRMTRPFLIGQNQLYVGVSIGAALAPNDGRDTESLLHRADLALYQAKSLGRGQLCYYQPGMDIAAQRLRKLEGDLRSALRRGQLSLVYQPLMSIETGQTEGVEALMRWNHPELGPISPSEFIAIAETTGIIVAIGDWAMRTACTAARDWPDDLYVSVNVSTVQFRHPGFVDAIRGVLAETGLAPRRLELEITENVLLHDVDEAITIFERVKALGISIAIDDFGTGYSSLSYLSRFAFDKIKIDGFFTQTLHLAPQSAAIIRAVLNLGRSLNIEVTAEGVETPEQLSFLTNEGCRHLQGYWFSAPISSDAVAARLSQEALIPTGMPNERQRTADQ
jgi:diguanylate cyclase (GGDEF)-like protein